MIKKKPFVVRVRTYIREVVRREAEATVSMGGEGH